MGLQNTPTMSEAPTHDVLRSQARDTNSSARSGRTSRSSKDHASAALEKSLLALTLRERQGHQNDTSYYTAADDLDYQRELEAEGVYEDTEEDWRWESDEVRLSKALRSWMSHYRITPLPLQMHSEQLPVFSARLGREDNSSVLHRVDSSESVNTQLSLFSCSSYGSRKHRERKRRRLRQKRTTTSADGRERGEGRPQSMGTGQGSRWVELARYTKGELDRFMKAQSHALTQGFNLTEESEAFQLCEADEQKALYACGQQNKLEFAAKLKKSDSMTNIKDLTRGKKRQRVASAGKTTFCGEPLDFQELRKQMIERKLAALNTTRRASGHRSIHRRHSRLSLTSVSSNEENTFFSPRTRTPVGVAETVQHHHSQASASSHRSAFPGEREGSGAAAQKSVNMWKGDAQILAIDLKRELTSKVKHRIAVTTSALERVTGVGDDNEQRTYTCHLPEFPSFVDEDYAHQPKIPQKIRIAPHLSDVIKSDIRVRMGRPRYHEIRIQDIEVWSLGQHLDRTHRNLKVFNWLHSLKEDEFEEASLLQTINDVPPDANDVSFRDMVLIRAADEPEVKPLYKQQKTYIR